MSPANNGTSSCACLHHSEARDRSARWASLVPILTCLVCPACLSAYAKVASFIGLGFSISENMHLGVLLVAVLVSISVSIWRSLQLQSVWPAAVSFVGCLALVLSHFMDENPFLMGMGVVILLGGGLWERQAFRRRGCVENA